ncbi:unnamed protein product [Ceratitis capitata]|uniref:(Mediterranean fruit fly) hypothetical protein n=1 Tax=Ceratitis capitata TaxID=7213 RepID=A0A811UU34_CERCA|nr:unnamed protein product [Ceratitis capitata]
MSIIIIMQKKKSILYIHIFNAYIPTLQHAALFFPYSFSLFIHITYFVLLCTFLTLGVLCVVQLLAGLTPFISIANGLFCFILLLPTAVFSRLKVCKRLHAALWYSYIARARHFRRFCFAQQLRLAYNTAANSINGREPGRRQVVVRHILLVRCVSGVQKVGVCTAGGA